MTFSNIPTSDAPFWAMPTKANGAKVYVKDAVARTFVLNSANRPSDWDTPNVIISS